MVFFIGKWDYSYCIDVETLVCNLNLSLSKYKYYGWGHFRVPILQSYICFGKLCWPYIPRFLVTSATIVESLDLMSLSNLPSSRVSYPSCTGTIWQLRCSTSLQLFCDGSSKNLSKSSRAAPVEEITATNMFISFFKTKAVPVDCLQKKHHILKSVHPSPLSASKGFIGCNHFSQCNTLLEEQGKTPIDWTHLPTN